LQLQDEVMSMLANVAEQVITPPLGTALFEPRDAPATAVRDDLFARALVLSDGKTQCCIVTLDLLGLDDALVQVIQDAVQQRTGLPATHLLLNVSHTHNAPLTLACCPSSQSLRDREWEAAMVDQVAECVARASDSLVEVSLSVAHAPAQIGVNRRLSVLSTTRMLPNPHGTAMKTVDVLRVERTDGKPLAVLFSHAAHPVTIHDTATVLSADYPGVATCIVRQHLGGEAIAMFAQGCAGDINVRTLRGGADAAEEIGRELATAVMNATCTRLPDGPLRVQSAIATLPFETMPRNVAEQIYQQALESAAALEAHDADARMRDDQLSFVAWATQMAQWPAGQMWGAGLPLPVTGVALGDACALICLPHEPFHAYQTYLQAHSPFAHTFVFGYTNQMLGYVPTASAFHLGGYEVQGAHKFFGLPRLLPACETIVNNTGMRVLHNLHSAM
jgi:hypothetical protein